MAEEKLRCWPDCEALVLWSEFLENIGKKVKVVERYRPLDALDALDPMWIIESPAGFRGVDLLTGESSIGVRVIVFDRALLPISSRPDSLAEERGAQILNEVIV